MTAKFRELAELQILQRLLMAVLREDIGGWKQRAGRTDEGFLLGKLRVPIARRYSMERFELAGFPTLDGQPLRRPTELLRVLLNGSLDYSGLAEEAELSADGLALSYAAASRRGLGPALNGSAHTRDLLYFEQRVIEGHPLHPGCRLRKGMSDAEQQELAPEWGVSYRLPIVALPVQQACDTGFSQAFAQHFPELNQSCLEEVGQGYHFLPLHPWQARHVLPEVAPHLKVLKARLEVRPTMSLRTVAPVGGGPHLKTAISVQTTGATRTVSRQAAYNGPTLSRYLKTFEHPPGLVILQEYGGLHLRDENSDRARQLSILMRENPEDHVLPGQLSMPAAALIEPGEGAPIVAELVTQHGGGAVAFFRDYARRLLRPLLIWMTRGISFEGHLQNIIAVFEEGMPVKFLYRDFGGVRIFAERLPGAPEFHPGSATVTDSSRELINKILYPVMQNHLGELVRVLHRHFDLPERLFWNPVADLLDELLVEPEEREAFLREYWELKAMTRMRLAGQVTEYTFCSVPNPTWPRLAARSHLLKLLAAALQREGLLEDTEVRVHSERQYAFGRADVDSVSWRDKQLRCPLELLKILKMERLLDELKNGLENLTLAFEKRVEGDRLPELSGSDPRLSDPAFFESLGLLGHNLHPGAKTRMGMSEAESLRYAADLDGRFEVPLFALREELAHAAGEPLERWFGEAPQGYRLLPVHPWQAEHVLPELYADLLADGSLMQLPQRIAVVATTSLRTVLPLDPELPALKLAVDSQMTSTVRSMSPQTVSNGPLYTSLLAGIKLPENFLPLAEPAGVRLNERGGRRERNLCCLARQRIEARPGELPVVASSFPSPYPGSGHQSLLQGLVELHPEGPDCFWRDYLRLLLPGHLLLLSRYGIALEAHLQNCVVGFFQGRPSRLWVRDWGGMRLWAPRLREWAPELELDPEAITVTEDYREFVNKSAYCLLQNHLGQVVIELCRGFSLNESELWAEARRQLDACYQELGDSADREALLQSTLAHKCLLTMRLHPDAGYCYRQLKNPLV